MELTVKNYRTFSDGSPLKIQIDNGNIAIVGPNNAGKSFVLKFFYEMRDFFEQLAKNITPHRITTTGEVCEIEIKDVFSAEEVFHRFNRRDMEIVISFVEASASKRKVKITFVISRTEPRKVKLSNFSIDSQNYLMCNINNDYIIKNDNAEFAKIANIKTIIAGLADTMYFPAFRNAINIGGKSQHFDISVGDAFLKQWLNFATDSTSAKRNSVIAINDDIKDIFECNQLHIISNPEQGTMHVAIDSQSFNLADLGSGITQFILVFVNAALKNPSYILIDEPEINLHPKMQIEFVNRLSKYAKKGIIFATHNLGLAHSVADRIYSIAKNKSNDSSIKLFEETRDVTQFLGELNYSNFASLGFNKVLMVEGITDVPVFSVLLHKLGIYKDVLLLPLGGSSMINSKHASQLAELQRFGNNVKVYVWIDSEITSKNSKIEPERLAFIENCKKLEFVAKIADKRATENYLPESAIEAFNPKLKQLKDFDALLDRWCKNDNWKIADKIQDIDKELAGTDLLDFLTKLKNDIS